VDSREASGQSCPIGWQLDQVEIQVTVDSPEGPPVNCNVTLVFCFKCGTGLVPDSIYLHSILNSLADPLECSLENIISTVGFSDLVSTALSDYLSWACTQVPCTEGFRYEHINIPTCGKIVQYLENEIPMMKIELCETDNYCFYRNKICWDYTQTPPVKTVLHSQKMKEGFSFCPPNFPIIPPYGVDPDGEWETNCFQVYDCE